MNNEKTLEEILAWADAEMNKFEGIGLTDNQIYIIKEVIGFCRVKHKDIFEETTND